MRKYSHEELWAAQSRGDYQLLWTAAERHVASTVIGMLKRGDVEGDKDDLIGEGNLAAGLAVRKWDPLVAAFSTYVSLRVYRAVMHYVAKQGRHSVQVVDGYAVEELPDQEAKSAAEAADAASVRELLTGLSHAERKLIQRHFGIGEDPMTVRELAVEHDVASSTLHRKVREILDKLATV